MGKQEFLEKLKSLLRVSTEDRNSLIEEYESYFKEAIADGATEEEVIAILETPEEIAATANDELGIKPKSDGLKDFVDEQVSAVKMGYETVIDSERMQEINDKIHSAMEIVRGTFNKVDFKDKLNQALEKVQESAGRIKDINFRESAAIFSMRFDNSKVESTDVTSKGLEVKITDSNPKKLKVEVVSHDNDNLVVKSLPTSMKCTVAFKDGKLDVTVAESNIRYSEAKRMRILVPDSIMKLTIDSECPLVLKDLEVDEITVTEGISPLDGRDITCKSLNLNCKAELSIRDISSDSIEIVTESGAMIARDISADKVSIVAGDGPTDIRDLNSYEVKLELGDGPVSIKDMDGKNHSYNIGSGPKSLKDISVESLELISKSGLLTLKDVSVELLTGDITGTTKSLKDVSAEKSEIEK